MKKNNIILMMALLLTGCSGSNDTSTITSTTESPNIGSYDNLTIISPTGAPAVCFYDFSDSENYETNATPSNIVASMTANGKDVVVIDTVSGVNAIKLGAPYKLLSTITFGNFYIAATGNDDDGVMDKDDEIIMFGKGQTPEKLFEYIYGTDYNLTYVTGNVSNAAKCLATGKNEDLSKDVDYVFVAQPVLFATLNNQSAATYGKASVYASIQEEYKNKSNNLSLIQASVFVKNTASISDINAFSDKLKGDIDAAILDSEVIKTGFSKISTEEATAKFGINSSVAANVLKNNNQLGLGYVKASENKTAINNFLSLFTDSGEYEDLADEIYF